MGFNVRDKLKSELEYIRAGQENGWLEPDEAAVRLHAAKAEATAECVDELVAERLDRLTDSLRSHVVEPLHAFEERQSTFNLALIEGLGKIQRARTRSSWAWVAIACLAAIAVLKLYW